MGLDLSKILQNKGLAPEGKRPAAWPILLRKPSCMGPVLLFRLPGYRLFVTRRYPAVESCGKTSGNSPSRKRLDTAAYPARSYEGPHSCRKERGQKWGTREHTYLDEDQACGFPSKDASIVCLWG